MGRHAVMAPFGVLAITVLLVHLSGRWTGWGSLNHAATLVDLGVVVYATVAVLVERGVNMIFWALEQRRKRREKLQAEAMAEGLAEGRAKGKAEGKAEERMRILQAAKEKGIDVAVLFPEEDRE